ncbi:hypothetical protein KAR91_84875 [Candidatus Pacearchaeota archaeon]|nr:hypothetical protein [Candidatus Pacearchaeota archaeon]
MITDQPGCPIQELTGPGGQFGIENPRAVQIRAFLRHRGFDRWTRSEVDFGVKFGIYTKCEFFTCRRVDRKEKKRIMVSEQVNV